MTQHSSEYELTIGATSIVAMNDRFGKRVGYVITNTSAAATVWLKKGLLPAEAGIGIKLLPNAFYYESNGENFKCWNGPVSIIGTAAGTISVSETFED